MNRPQEDQQLATLWQTERDGHLTYELRIPVPVPYQGNPTSEDVWRTFVISCAESAIAEFRSSPNPVTPS